MLDTMAFPGLVVLTGSAIAAFTDVWNFKVYNLLTIPLMASGLAYHAMLSGTPGLVASLAGLVFSLGVFLIPYSLGAIGAGDVKFMAGVGAWLGSAGIVYVTLCGCLLTGVYSVGVILYHRQLRGTWVNFQILLYRLRSIGQYLWHGDGRETVQDIAKQPDRRRRLVPVSAMMAAGVLAYILWRQ